MANNTLELLNLLKVAKDYVDEDTLASVASALAKGKKEEKKEEDTSGLSFLLKAMSGMNDSKDDEEARAKEDAALISILEARGYTVTKKSDKSDVMGILSSLGEKAEEAGLMDKLGDILVDSAKKATKKTTTKKASTTKKSTTTKKTTTKKTTKK